MVRQDARSLGTIRARWAAFRGGRERAKGGSAGDVGQGAAGRDDPPGAGARTGRRQVLLSFASGAAGLFAGWLTSPRPWISVSLGGDVGKLCHDWSKTSPEGLIASAIWSGGSPPRIAAQGDKIPLPSDFSDRGMSVEEAIERRRSIRAYSSAPMSLLQLSRLLHRADGITDPTNRFRAAPSAGALYPLEIYILANNVEELTKGIYRYDFEGHSLRSVQAGDYSRHLLVAALSQSQVLGASVVLVLAAIFERTRWKYHERSYRYVLMECGHVAQNVYLAATSMGLGACVIGAFLDDELNGILRLDGQEEAALYIVTVGRP